MTEDDGHGAHGRGGPDPAYPHDATESIPIARVPGVIPIIVPLADDPRTADPVVAVPVPIGWSDPVTGNDGPAFWDRIVLTEHARVRRYKRPATIAFVEVAGLETFARQWGRDIAQRLLVRIGRTLAKEVRSSDCSARIEPTRFGVLLTETDEIAAINFVERARAACEAQLGRAGQDLRIGIGWASLSSKDLGTALDTATARLAADLERDA